MNTRADKMTESEREINGKKSFFVNLLICLISNSLIHIFISPLFLLFLQILMTEKDKAKLASTEKRKAADQEAEPLKDLKKVIVMRNVIQALITLEIQFSFLVRRRNWKQKL